MNDPNIYPTIGGRRVAADGGTAAAAQNGGIAPGGAAVDAVEEMTGGDGFEAAVAHSQWRRAVATNNEKLAKRAMAVHQNYRANAGQLRRDEYEQIDQTVKTVARQQLVALGDLLSRGLTIDLDLGTLRWTWEDVDDTGDADVDMAGTTGANEDVPDFDETGIPLPLVHKSFYFNRRKLMASRKKGEPIDTTMAAQSTRSVREKLEDIVFNGVPGLLQDGDQVYGYTTHPDRAQPTANATWDGATADNIIDDVMSTVEGIEDQNLGGSEIAFYVCRQSFQEARAKNAGTDDKRGVLQLLRDRLESEADFPGVTFRRADFLDDGEAVAVEMNPMTVELAVASDFQTVEWETNGGWTVHNKVLASMMPALKSDRNGNIGISHLTGI
jgi:hypothetical protein